MEVSIMTDKETILRDTMNARGTGRVKIRRIGKVGGGRGLEHWRTFFWIRPNTSSGARSDVLHGVTHANMHS